MRMKRKNLIVLALLLLAAFAAQGAEKQIAKKDLPPAVQKTAEAQARGATIRGYAKDHEDGQWEYEVEMWVDGHSKDVTIAPDGRLLEVEEEVSLGALPPAVRAGLRTRAKKGTITKVESITRHGKIVAYEAQVAAAGRHREIQVGPDGGRLAHEE